jgi:HTH-type transcriptional repressor of NAD biosynthesis genes
MSEVGYATGLVVGKFAPLHLGHLQVVDRAHKLCSRVIIISYTNPEFSGCEPEKREAWLEACCPDTTRLVVTNDRLREWLRAEVECKVPLNTAPDDVHRAFVAMLCLTVLHTAVQAVFTSEDYGDGFAAALTEIFRRHARLSRPVAHVRVDSSRLAFPITGTALRTNLWQHWRYLPPQVAQTFVRRVVFLGGESSGKSSLAEAMARKFQTEFVAEYGRELWDEKSGTLEFEDLASIAREQIRREEYAIQRARQFVFCDTSPLTTLFYSLELFGKADPELLIAADRNYDRVVLCSPDFPFVQDGTRGDETFRLRQHEWYLRELSARGVPFFVLGGGFQERIAILSEQLLVRDRAP